MLNAEIMARYGLAKDWRTVGFFETENHRRITHAVRSGLGSGRLVAITGPVGIGKTVFLHRLQDEIAREKKVTVAESLSVDKTRTTVPTLIAALFYDLSREKEPKIPTQGEKRERELQKLVARSGKPVALFVDEAHDLHSKTLVGLKRLMEVIARGGGNLSVILVGHPKLRNDLRRPTMEEIGHRTDILPFEGLGEDVRKYLDWLLEECSEDGADVSDAIEPAALDLMAERLTTPLQFAEYLNHAFEAGFQIGQKPVTSDIVSASLAPDFDDLEPRLTRQGYSVKVLADQFQAKPTEIRRFLSGQLDTSRTRELADQMRMAGLSI
ncbi:ATPase AAA [Ruegeria sp. ANG-R]|uniref:ExeA family protein n=1 Tax=Ruegeria sp. ANG-R TaxID=1577903 RepID=UPI00057D3E3E|nr:AAA family ATPase [Ruegeria sp. ANG-R]KIC39817.1 ATPase AAA [Ruegeria sp. ANG-R]